MNHKWRNITYWWRQGKGKWHLLAYPKILFTEPTARANNVLWHAWEVEETCCNMGIILWLFWMDWLSQCILVFSKNIYCSFFDFPLSIMVINDYIVYYYPFLYFCVPKWENYGLGINRYIHIYYLNVKIDLSKDLIIIFSIFLLFNTQERCRLLSKIISFCSNIPLNFILYKKTLFPLWLFQLMLNLKHFWNN